jgi:hypothetical protein
MFERTMKWRALASSVVMVMLAGCGAAGSDGDGGVSVRPEQSTQTPDDGTPNPNPADPNAPSTNVGGPDFNVSDDEDDGLAPMGCQQAEREFVPNIPTVYLLVDRSGTMFDSIGNNVSAWTALRGGALQVMRELEASVRFGFAAFSGANIGAQMCDLQVPTVPAKLNNYADIAALYEPLGQPTNSKDTPTLLALEQVASQLRQDAETVGDKYILFVTDGEPDYCDDGNQLCPPDSVVGLLQRLSSGVDATGAAVTPIRTLVFGISSPTATIRADVLQSFANAGAGLPVLAISQNPGAAPDPNALYDQCNGVPGWRTDFTATGKPAMRGESVGDYVFDPTLAGNAPVFRPDPADQAALTEQLRTALAGVKSCTFDLGEDNVQVDVNRADLGQRARVIVNGQPVVYDAANGWSMMSQTTVVLNGAACEMWRNPLVATTISFDFPCDIFIPR